MRVSTEFWEQYAVICSLTFHTNSERSKNVSLWRQISGFPIDIIDFLEQKFKNNSWILIAF